MRTGSRRGIRAVLRTVAPGSVAPGSLSRRSVSLALSGLIGSLALTAVGAPGLGDPGRAAPTTGHDPKPQTPTGQARAVLLTRADLPAGWVATSVGGAPTHTAPLSGPLATCIGVSSSVATVKPLRVSSPGFAAPDRSAAVEDSASVYASTAQASAAYKALANPRTPSCMGTFGAGPLQTSIGAEAGRHATVDSISIGPLPAGAAEPYQTGFVAHIPLTVDGKNLTIDRTEIDFVKGKVLQQLTFDAHGGPFTPLEQVHLLQIATGHP